jgi:hypothetical protein
MKLLTFGVRLEYHLKTSPHVKRGLIQNLHKRASTICQEQQDLFNEISSMRHDLKLNGYPQAFINSVKQLCE